MSKEVKKPEIVFVVIHIIIMVFMLILSSASIISIVRTISLHDLYSKGNYVLEYATIVEYKEDVHNGYIDFVTYYEYVSPGGITYTGIWDIRIKTEEEAKAQIGKKVPVYIDHELKLQKKTYSLTSTWIYGAMATICFGIFLNSFIREILNIKRWRRYKRTPIEPEENEGDEWNE